MKIVRRVLFDVFPQHEMDPRFVVPVRVYLDPDFLCCGSCGEGATGDCEHVKAVRKAYPNEEVQ